MSSPIQPPLTVETVDGTTSGRPITTIKVTNGDLTVSGSTATIDTSGGGGGGSGTVTSVGSPQAFITITSATTTPSISIGNASGAATGVLTASDFNTFDAKQGAITLTTTGSTGVATFTADTLNIPNYTTPQASYLTLGTDAGLTDERVLTAGTGIAFTDTGAGGTLTIEATGGGGGSPGGSDTQIQYNNGGSFGGSDVMTFDDTASAEQVLFSSSSSTALLKIEQTGTGNAFEVHDATAPDSNRFEIDQFGRASVQGTAGTSGSSLYVGGNISTAGRVRGVSGTAASPSYSNDSDTNTGVFFPAADEIGFSNAGTETLRFGSSGEILVGGSAAGTSGQVLTSGGASAAVSWSTVSGGNEFNLELPGTDTNSGNNDLYLVSRMPGWGSNYNGSSTLNSDENPYFWPWISPLTGSITCCIDVTADGTGTLAIAIYTDENGVPKTKIGGDASYVFGSTGTGFKELSFSSAVSVTRGTQYWIGIVESSIGNGAIRAENGSASYSASPRFNSPSDLTSVTSTGVSLSNSDNTLPASITASDLESNSRGQPRWGIRV